MTPRRLLIAGTLLTALFVWYYSAQLLTAYAGAFQIDNASRGADAIIVLGGNVETRPDHAAKLVRDGYASTLLLTTLRPMKTRHESILRHETELAQEILATYDLQAKIIPSLKSGATSTFDEAYDLVTYLEQYPMKHVIIVTDAFHTSRAHYAFSKIFEMMGKEDVVIEMAAAPNEIFDSSNWWQTERGLKAYILEPVKYLFYRFSASNSTQFKED